MRHAFENKHHKIVHQFPYNQCAAVIVSVARWKKKKSKKPKKKIENQSGLYLKQSYTRNNQPIYHNKQLKQELQTIQNFDTLIDANGQRIYQQPS